MFTTLNPSERRSLWILFGLLCLALGLSLFGPQLHQSPTYHHFADQRTWASIPFVGDVLSNAAFAVLGVFGSIKVATLPAGQQRQAASVFFIGLMFTAAGSSWYHWGPDNRGLFVDRLAMVPAFAGLLGLAVGERVSARIGSVVTFGALFTGVLSVCLWWSTRNFWPWSVFQAGGMLLVLWCAAQTHRADQSTQLNVAWVKVIALYALAKAFELGDHEVFSWLGGSISGHSLKHLLAALAAWPVIAAIRQHTHVKS